MAKKLLDLEEAATMLGVSPDALNEMRERREVHAYRDGASWKFKLDEIERVLADRTDSAGDLEIDDNIDSILLSDEIGQSGPGTSSTVIGKTNDPGSDIQIGKSSPQPGASDVRLASESDVLAGGSGLSAKFDELDSLDLELPSPSESGLSLGSDLKLSDDLSLDDDDLALGGEPTSRKPGSSKKGSKAGGSSLELSADDDDLVLGGSGVGSDITHKAGDSGISLVDPADSGLSLEEAPLELAGSAVESLELGEDDMILLEEEGEGEGATQLKADDDFLLTPLDDAGGDESDSGSQVIALDSEGDFDEAAATMLGSRPAMSAMLEEDMGSPGAGVGLGSAGGGFGGGAGLAGGPALMPTQVMEAPFSGATVGLLTIGVVFLTLSGMMMYDLMRNMWSWNGTYSVNSSLMDTVLKWFE